VLKGHFHFLSLRKRQFGVIGKRFQSFFGGYGEYSYQGHRIR
jgi:hypothetical protein